MSNTAPARITQFAVSALCLLLSFSSLKAQNPPQPVPRIPDPYPTIGIAPVSGNPKNFGINWTADYAQTPTPFDSAQTILPLWNIVWNFGDGLFSLEPSPGHAFGDTITKVVSLKMVASYSGDRPPPVRKGSASALLAPSRPNNVFNSNFGIQTAAVPVPDNRDRIRLVPHVAAARIGDTLSVASIFRTLGLSADQFQSNYILEVEVPAGVKIYDINNSFAPSGNALNFGNSFQWNINLFPTQGRIDLNPENREGARWFGFHFSDDVLSHLPTSALTAANDLPDSLPQYDAQLSFILKLKNIGQPPRDNQGGNVINLDNPDDPGASVVNLNVAEEVFNLPVRLAYARDPNSLSCTPSTICSLSDVPGRWEFMVHFENLGSAAAQTVKVFPKLDAAFDPSTVTLISHSPAGGGITCTWDAGQGCFILSKTSGAVLPSKQEAIALGFPVTAATGYVSFYINPDAGHAFHMGDQLSSRALIRMDQDSVWTNTALTTFGGAACRGEGLPWVLGLKAGVNRAFVPFDFGGPGGFHAGVTFRKALTKLPAAAETRRRIGPDELPAWWYQAEIMYGSYIHEKAGDKRTWTALDLVPLQIRWVPKGKTLPGFGPRSLAISAGYQLSMPLSADFEDPAIELEPGLFNRLEHGVFGDVAVFNPIGVPGLSLGGRLHIKQFRVLEDAPVEPMFQLYLHYNLKQLR